MIEYVFIVDVVCVVKLGVKDYLFKFVYEELLMELLWGLIGLLVFVFLKKLLMKRFSGVVWEIEWIVCCVVFLNCFVMIFGLNGSGKEFVV